ncbi:ATP synthase F1 subunit gamma [Clostridium gasigenes]|uniref:ATP synthase gamma chain n=1 Tax=Clostridium gasigenes TaxID=94869 RepID=A0A1H0RVC1_9CLOT|nr:ATP synthase F1 subunit gamma [Clostridium gasigenes]MBB6622612.1 F0F1 ATP synthase subunit gamma [Clostridium gasigenes]MBU3088544.1 F0F1 ATP synthase subunit gamma [Clostridium gasigenes]MBU3103860.1 F0F1 ATP synthase subunit gamma [Clostridium gasigenes]MBU3108191.1 F0F1 ATP synthase subunit gamma [Clostridium gasigenes]MBU3132799.1 F0F1 ATP synthase subunit gamma [Clostridium gasigenes]
MGAAGLIDIKRRIKSVESTRKITKAMGLVATSKLRKSRKELTSSEEHYSLCEDIVNELMGVIPEDFDNPYLKSKGKTSDKLYIVMASDMGLCGGFNGNVANNLNLFIKDKDRAKVIIVGSKGISYMNRYKFDVVGQYVEISDIPTVREIKAIYQDALYMFKKGDICEVNIVYTKFISPMKQEVKIDKLLPMDKTKGNNGNFLIEPSMDEVLNSSLDVYFKSRLRRSMLHSKASEQSYRMTAMNGATQNADDILKALKIKFNRIRQSAITQEISEIVGGAAAQK